MPDDQAYGDGTCAVCKRRCSVGSLMCGPHWRMVPRDVKARVIGALNRWAAGGGTLADLRAAQNIAVASVTRRTSSWRPAHAPTLLGPRETDDA